VRRRTNIKSTKFFFSFSAFSGRRRSTDKVKPTSLIGWETVGKCVVLKTEKFGSVFVFECSLTFGHQSLKPPTKPLKLGAIHLTASF
jgi:hypothetical protein